MMKLSYQALQGNNCLFISGYTAHLYPGVLAGIQGKGHLFRNNLSKTEELHHDPEIKCPL